MKSGEHPYKYSIYQQSVKGKRTLEIECLFLYLKKAVIFWKITADTGYLLQNPYFLYDRRKVETVFHESVKSQGSVPVLYDPCSNTVVKNSVSMKTTI